MIELLDAQIFGLFLPAGSAALHIASHLNRIVTRSFIFFGISVALFGVVRATGAVIAPLIVLTISLLLVRFPLAELFLDQLPGRCGLVELPGLLGAVLRCSRSSITSSAAGAARTCCPRPPKAAASSFLVRIAIHDLC